MVDIFKYEALEAARQGMAVWNAWSKQHADSIADFSDTDFTQGKYAHIDFSDFVFNGPVYFDRARFGKAVFDRAIFQSTATFERTLFEEEASFKNAKFNKRCDFLRARFNDDIGFQDAVFGDDALFLETSYSMHLSLSGTSFKADVTFLGATFLGSVSFEGSDFEIVPDLCRSEFRKHVTFDSANVTYRTPAKKGDAAKYRRLKELAVLSRDHDKEHEFFAYELMSKRGHEVRGLELVPSYIYELSSDFGRSLRRPFGLLVLVWFAFGFAYTVYSEKAWEIGGGLLYSLNILFSFVPGSLNRTKAIEGQIFSGTVPNLVNFLTILEGVFGIALIFLFVLAIRNRFRV